MQNLAIQLSGGADTEVIPHIRAWTVAGGAVVDGAAPTLALPHRRTVIGSGGLVTGGVAFLRVILRRVGTGGTTVSGAALVAFVDRNRYEFVPA